MLAMQLCQKPGVRRSHQSSCSIQYLTQGQFSNSHQNAAPCTGGTKTTSHASFAQKSILR